MKYRLLQFHDRLHQTRSPSCCPWAFNWQLIIVGQAYHDPDIYDSMISSSTTLLLMMSYGLYIVVNSLTKNLLLFGNLIFSPSCKVHSKILMSCKMVPFEIIVSKCRGELWVSSQSRLLFQMPFLDTPINRNLINALNNAQSCNRVLLCN